MNVPFSFCYLFMHSEFNILNAATIIINKLIVPKLYFFYLKAQIPEWAPYGVCQ